MPNKTQNQQIEIIDSVIFSGFLGMLFLVMISGLHFFLANRFGTYYVHQSGV